MKDYYALLSVAPDATADDIKRAFRREIARYHPDKVIHLGQEFQTMAAERATDLTEAYRVLTDPKLRSVYDGKRGHTRRTEWVPPETGHPERPATAPPPPPPPKSAPGEGRDTFMRRAALSRFRAAVEKAVEGVTSMPARGFEASYLVSGKRTLFGKPVAERVMTSYIGNVTAVEVSNLGQQALAARGDATSVTVFALGDKFGSGPEISAAIAGLRKKVPAGVALVVVPVDVRDWTAMMPKDASANARAIVAQLTAKD